MVVKWNDGLVGRKTRAKRNISLPPLVLGFNYRHGLLVVRENRQRGFLGCKKNGLSTDRIVNNVNYIHIPYLYSYHRAYEERIKT